MSIRYKTSGKNVYKLVGALTLLSVTVAGAQEKPPSQKTPPEKAPPAQKPAPGEKKSTSKSQAKANPDADQPTARELLNQARSRLNEFTTLKAQVIEVVEFGPRQYKAEGVYLQGTDHRLRLDLKITMGSKSGRLLQVCDGDILWTVYRIDETPRVTRRDVTQILSAIKKSDIQNLLARDLGLGGIPALLASVERSMVFEPPIAATIDGRKFHVIQGRWKPQLLRQFQQQAQKLSSESADAQEARPLPRHVPDLVRIYLDAETSFPYRIRYLKESPLPGEVPEPLLTLDFRDIVVNDAINPVEFRYSAPDGANVLDLTNFYLQKLRRAGAAGKRATQQNSKTP